MTVARGPRRSGATRRAGGVYTPRRGPHIRRARRRHRGARGGALGGSPTAPGRRRPDPHVTGDGRAHIGRNCGLVSDISGRMAGTPDVRPADVAAARAPDVRAAGLSDVGAARTPDVRPAGISGVRARAAAGDISDIAVSAASLSGALPGADPAERLPDGALLDAPYPMPLPRYRISGADPPAAEAPALGAAQRAAGRRGRGHRRRRDRAVRRLAAPLHVRPDAARVQRHVGEAGHHRRRRADRSADRQRRARRPVRRAARRRPEAVSSRRSRTPTRRRSRCTSGCS